MTDVFEQIDIQAAKEMVDEDAATLVDIRDHGSFAAGHIDGAHHVVDQEAAERLIADAPKDRPLLVYCYHGMSSQQAAYFFAQQGFGQVYSMIGGFEAWRMSYPHTGTDG